MRTLAACDAAPNIAHNHIGQQVSSVAGDRSRGAERTRCRRYGMWPNPTHSCSSATHAAAANCDPLPNLLTRLQFRERACQRTESPIARPRTSKVLARAARDGKILRGERGSDASRVMTNSKEADLCSPLMAFMRFSLRQHKHR